MSRLNFYILIVFGCILPMGLWALPFNDDMVDSQIKTGQVMRPAVPGTVPIGSLGSNHKTKEEATELSNPNSTNKISLTKGKTLFATNCYPCHGNITSDGDKYKPGPVARFVPGPNLALEMYHNSGSGSIYTDGKLFATIAYGNVLMPALGYKLSDSEMWDIVNYVRSVQETQKEN